MTTDWADLAGLCDAQYRMASARLARARAEERCLRAALEEIEADARRVLLAPEGLAYHAAGTGVAWQGWLGRRRAALTRDIGLAAARRGEAEERLRVCLSQKEAAAARLRAAAQADARKRQRRAEAEILRLQMLR